MSLDQLQRLDRSRRKVAGSLTVVMTVLYVAFILLIAYAKPWLTQVLMPGLSIGILLGVVVILAAWLLIWVYVRWANVHYDSAIAALRDRA